MVEKCSNCKYFKRNPQDMRKGDCREDSPRAFPVPAPGGVLAIGIWPPVQEDGWCGKHKPALQVQ